MTMISTSDDFEFDPATSPANGFRKAMRRLATTVSVVTTASAGRPFGMTATAVTSLSTEPPSLLFCVNRNASIFPTLESGAKAYVNLLNSDQARLAEIFGGKVLPEERFFYGAWAYDESGVPFLADAQANLSCTIDAIFAYATHGIFVGKVDVVRLRGEVRPLIFGDGRFWNIEAV
jgi:flavin reductase